MLGGMKIRRRSYASGRVAWQLDLGLVDGKRKQMSYESKADAERALKGYQQQRQRHGELGSELTPGELAELIACRNRVEAAGGTLAGAVEYWLDHARRVRHPAKIEDLVKGFIDARERANCSARYVRQLGVCLGAFARSLPLREAHKIQRADVESWLNGQGWASKTKNNYLGDLRALFAWALTAGHVAFDPCKDVGKWREAEGEIGTLTMPEIEQLLMAVVKRPDLAGYVIIGLFGGLRPAELERMDWMTVNALERTVIVLGATAKTRRRRVVDLSTNAEAWLHAAYPEGVPLRGRLCTAGFDERWIRFRASLGYNTKGRGKGRPWPHNALRHTYASMHYAWHQNEAILQAQMGHQSATMLHRHYRALKTRAAAEKFWGLRPGVTGHVSVHEVG